MSCHVIADFTNLNIPLLCIFVFQKPRYVIIFPGTMNRQYGVGMSMRQSGQSAPPVAPPTVPSHYMSSDQLRMAQQPVPPMGNVANPLYGRADLPSVHHIHQCPTVVKHYNDLSWLIYNVVSMSCFAHQRLSFGLPTLQEQLIKYHLLLHQ